jgi:hypothetical protein
MKTFLATLSAQLRMLLRDRPALTEALIELGRARELLRQWVNSVTPELPEELQSPLLANLPRIIARNAAARWLINADVPPEALLLFLIIFLRLTSPFEEEEEFSTRQGWHPRESRRMCGTVNRFRKTLADATPRTS